MPNLALGRKPRTFRPSIPHMSALISGRKLPPIPPSADWLTALPSALGVMGNDSLGDCTCAGLGHAIQVWSGNAEGSVVTIPDSDVLEIYEQACGYVPGDPSTDQGGVEQDVLAWAHKTGIPTPGGPDKIAAFVEIDVRNLHDICRGINEFGLVYIGFNVPAYLMNNGPPQVWDVNPVGDQTIVGGHCVVLPSYVFTQAPNGYISEATFGLISWGEKFAMTAAFFRAFVDEAYAIADAHWIEATGVDPLGMTLAQLEAQMRAL